MEALILVAIVGVVGYCVFKLFRTLFQTWKVSIPVIVGGLLLLGVLASGNNLKPDDMSALLAFIVIVAIVIIYKAADARCPQCKKLAIRKAESRELSTSNVFQMKCSDGDYHPHQRITGETIYRCQKCGYERTSRWTREERLDI